MRLAARSNWLSTMAFPDIVARGVTGAFMEPRVASSLAGKATAAQAGRRVLDLGQGAGDVAAARPAPARVGQNPDHVGTRNDRLLGRVLEDEHQPRGVVPDGVDQ